MAYTTINKSSDYFNTKLWTGDGTSPRSLTGIGFQPDWTIIKKRNTAASHVVFDAVRTAGSTKGLATNSNAIEGLTATEGTTANYGYVSSFDSDGFTVTAGATQNAYVNNTSDNYVSWNWKANGQGSANTDGDINSTYTSANTTSGFSIITYTGTGSAGTIGHGLGVVPKMIWIKKLNATGSWSVYHEGLTDSYQLYLDLDSAQSSSVFDPNPTSTVFSLPSTASFNASGDTYVAYCFAPVRGFSKFGSYEGNTTADGVFIYTGFKPAFIMIKSYNTAARNWTIQDNKRSSSGGPNPNDKWLYANSSEAEANQASNPMDFLSNGFKLRNTGSYQNQNAYIYMAIAEAPLVGSNNVPCTAR